MQKTSTLTAVNELVQQVVQLQQLCNQVPAIALPLDDLLNL